MERVIKDIILSFSELHIEISRVGEDYSIVISGGFKPHIGCAVLSIPRTSLTGDGSISCTSSVINVLGHKDEEICRLTAEMICKKKNVAVVCAGGFHVDDIKEAQIREVVNAVYTAVAQIE